MKRLAQFVSRFSVLIIIMTLVITIVFAYFALQIDIKAGIRQMFPENDQAVRRYDKVEELFGGISYVVVMIEDDDVLDTETLLTIQKMSQELASLESVDEVTSLATVKNLKSSDFGIEIEDFMRTVPVNDEEIEQLKTDLLNNETYLDSLVSRDFKSAIIMVTSKVDGKESEDVVYDVEKVISKHEGEGEHTESFYVTGPTVLATVATEYMKKDLTRLLPFIIGIIALILWLTFKSVRGIILPLATVLISVVWAVGLLAILGKSLSMISTVLPVLLVSVGSAYAIHFISRYYEELSNGYNVRESLNNSIQFVGIAVIMAGCTTMAGFSSLISSPLRIIKEFGLATAFGVGVALLISITFVPAVLLNMSPPSKVDQAEKRPVLNKFFKWITQVISHNQWVIIGLAIFLALGSLVIIPQLKPETNYISYFKQNSPPRLAMERVDQRFGGAMSLELVVHGNITDPELLRRMEQFQQEVQKIERINQSVSIVNILKEENKALHGGDLEMKVLPTTEKQIAQYLLLLTMSDEEFIQDYLTFDQSATRIQMRVETASSNQIKETIEEVNTLAKNSFDELYEIELTGVPMLMSEMINRVVSSQIKSLIISVLFTFFLTSILLRSIKYGLFCSLPISLTILLNFGIMGWMGIPLDFATSMIASVAVGIGVDYSIHIFSRYLEEQRQQVDSYQALSKAIYTVGQANLYNAVAVVAGFSVILFSSFSPLVNFGGLTAATIIISFVGAVLILPAAITSALQLIQDRNKHG